MKNLNVFSGMQMNRLAVVAGVFCLSIAAGVSAEEVDKPCVADARKLCKDVQPGEGRVARCMKEHEKELSPGCRENIGKMKEKARDVAEACKDDAGRLCKDVEPGKGRILRCLKQHEGELSAACKEQMPPPRGRR
ncbi:MAG: cysteine rich repeat-containing protein [Pseudomonadota bacterium]